MPDQRIDQLNAETTPAAADVLPVFSIAGADTKKITVKNLVQVGATLIDDASIPGAKVNLSGIGGTLLTDGTVTVAKLNTAGIPATGGVTVSSGNLQLVAPTSPIARNASTGSLEHAVSGVTAGTYTKLTVDTKGHVTVGAAIAAADLPISISGTVGVVSPGTGLSVTGGGVLNHVNSVTAGTTSGITFDAQGHITSTVALAGADLPIATGGVIGGVRPGSGLTVDGSGILAVTAATNAALGGVIAGADFGISTGTISLATQGALTPGTYTKATFNSKGIATGGTTLVSGDIPNLNASIITSGSLDIARIAANTVTGAKIANYAVTKIGDTQPTADHIGQFFFNPLSRDLALFDGNVFQPIGISVGEIVFAGTFDASLGSGTGLISSVTVEGTAIGLAIGQALPAPAAGNSRYYLVVAEAGTITTGNAPHVALSPPDILLSNGITWTEIDVSQTITAQVASNVSFTPAGSIVATNVQVAIQELDGDKLAIAGGTVTGNLEIGTAGSLSFEGATANNFETTLAVVDPTADRTITLPDATGTVVTTGDTGSVTSTMLLDGTILNADVNASAAIAYSKLATLTSGNVVLGSSANVATSTAITGDVTISNLGVTAIASGVIVNADIDAAAAIAGSKIVAATTSVVGVVQLSDSHNTTSSVLAATPTAVKVAFDAATVAAIDANAALPKAGGTLTGNVILDNQVDARFREATANGTNYVGFQGPATIAADVLWTLPATDGTAGQALVTDGATVLGWAAVGTGDVTLTGTQTLTNKTLTAPTIASANLTTALTLAGAAGTNGQVLTSAGSGLPSWTTPSSGGVVGPASATANGIALFDGTTGSLLKNAASTDGLINGLTVGKGLTSKSESTAFGVNALAAVDTGNSNTAIGINALTSNTSASNNTAVGRQALLSMVNGGNNTAIGNNALVSADTGTNNVACGATALQNLTSGRGCTSLNPRTAAGSYAPVFDPTTQDDRFCMGSTAVTNAYIQVAWTVVSDIRDKTDIATVPHGLNFITQIEPIAYRYKKDRNAREGHGPVRYGFKAQQLLEIEKASSLPVIIDNEDESKLRLNDQSLLAVMVNAIKELTQRVELLEIAKVKGK